MITFEFIQGFIIGALLYQALKSGSRSAHKAIRILSYFGLAGVIAGSFYIILSV